MNPEDHKQVQKILLISIMVNLLVIVVIIALGVWQFTKVNKRIDEIISHTPTASEIVPLSAQPKDGKTPVKGVDYFDGQDGRPGKNAVSFTAIETHIIDRPLKGDTGSVGPQGEKGDAAPVVFYRINPETNAEECMFNGDTEWQPFSECQ